MNASGGGALVSRALELNLHNQRRGSALRWSLFDGTLLLIFLYDLFWSSGCAGATWWVEGACAGAVLWALLTHIRTLTRTHTTTLTINKEQQRLLGLSDNDLDSSFRIVDTSELSDSFEVGASSGDEEVHSLSLSSGSMCEESPPRVVGRSPPSSPLLPSPPLPPSPPPPPYRLSVRTPPPAPPSPPAAGPAPSALHEARALNACTLNLRLWIHVTIVERLVRELEAVDAALAGHEAALGEVSVERALAAGAAAGVGGAVKALLPYLEGAGGDARYVVRRLRELGRQGALAGYRGARGGGPVSDEELLHHWLCTYMRAVAAGGRGDELEPVRRGPGHYEVAGRAVRGRGATLGAWLLAVGGAAHRDPPHWGRTHLGANGLNLLWVLQDTPPTLPHTIKQYH